MNRIFLLLSVLLFNFLLSCNGAAKPSASVGVVEKSDSCQTDAQNSYELYIPKRASADEKLPLLVIIDSHGAGKFALQKFKQAANKYHAALVASNLVKNGYTGYDAAIMSLINDVRQKYPVAQTVFLTGFSGGARMALGYAQAHSVDGLILCGALAAPEQISALRCPIISISGMDDFNFMETAQYLFQEQARPANLKIELTSGSHDWPDSLLLANAFGFLRLSYQSEELLQASTEQIANYCREQESRIAAYKKQGDYLKAALIAENLSVSSVFDADKKFTNLRNSLKSSSQYTGSMQRLGNSLNQEMNIRQPYINAFTQKDSVWWKTEIAANELKIKTEKDAYMRDMYRRVKGFCGIACFTLGNQAIQQHNANLMTKLVFIYRSIEPENPYVYYFAAFPAFWNGKTDEAVALLQKALKFGFTDINQMKKDFPHELWARLLKDK